jgi:molybdate/tungstate transport system ATP-binding protein
MIDIKNLSLRLGSFSLKEINLAIEDKEYLVILGPTGAGKTILLECIAGLHKIKRGEIWVNGNNVTHLTPEDRHIGYIPQDYVLFPFLNVKDNIAFGLRQTRYNKAEAQERIKTLAYILGISHLMERDTRSLSGGEKQRVSIARALAPSADVLLLDEPFSSLDQQTSKHLRLELRRIHKQLGITTIHVTHNQVEAEEIGDRIAILNCGKLEQIDVPNEIFFTPKSEMVSNFVGGLNILDCETCRSIGPALVEVKCGSMHIILPHDEGLVQKIAISPRDVYVSDIAPPGPSVNRFKGIVVGIKQTGVIVELEIKVGENTIRSETTTDLFTNMGLSVGSMVFIILKLRRLKTMNHKESI